MKRRISSAPVDLVCDPGSGVVKAGLFGDRSPRILVVRKCGDETSCSTTCGSAESTCRYPLVQRGAFVVEETTAVSRTSGSSDLSLSVWEQILTSSNELLLEDGSAGGSIVVTENACLTQPVSRGKLLEVLFESFGFARANVVSSAGCVLTARGVTSGLVVDVGETHTEIVPVNSGFVQRPSVRIACTGGRDVTVRLGDLIKRTDPEVAIDVRKKYSEIRKIKENLCYIAANLEEEKHVADITNVLVRKSSLPDGTLVALNKERFLAPEILFSPAGEGTGISQSVYESVTGCPIDSRAELFGSIVLAGGSTLMPGFVNRLYADLRRICDDKSNSAIVRIDAVPERQNLAFSGASIMAELHAVRESENRDDNTVSSKWWISKSDYDEMGPKRAAVRLG